jgi:putative glutamine amidotransferase
MKRVPLVLISGSTERKGVEFDDLSLSLSLNYPRAIAASGGAPWLLPCLTERQFIAESVRRCDGVMLTGGDDVQPRLYAESISPALQKTVHAADPRRDLFELMLIGEVFRQHKPLLCICRGHQILNVALGGTLLVDIKTQLPQALNHSRSDRKDRIVHEVQIEPGSLIARIAGRTALGVNSSHHQAVARTAKPLRATAVSKDGVIEAMELAPGARGLLPYLLAVQFHPERLYRRHREHDKLFKSFTDACSVPRPKK